MNKYRRKVRPHFSRKNTFTLFLRFHGFIYFATFPVELRKNEMGAKRKEQEAKVGNGKKQERKWCTSERRGVVASTGRDKDEEKQNEKIH